MSQRPIIKYCPGLERFEERQLLSAGSSFLHSADPPGVLGTVRDVRNNRAAPTHPPVAPGGGYLAFRVTQKSYTLIPPFQQVLVQTNQPVPGQVYNVNYVALKNQTAKTFDTSSGFTVRLNNQTRSHAYPILTGTEQWKPQQVIVFYVLTKKYYPVSFVPGGFQFNLGGRSSTLIPGPSGIFLRLKYNPATFARTLDWIVAFGQGAQLGVGPRFGMPDTAINAFVSAKTRRMDFGGHF
jgi:hypothetical protein